VAEREQADGEKEQRREQDVASCQSQHDDGDGYADSERSQHERTGSGCVAEDADPARPPPRGSLPVAADRLVVVTRGREVVTR
jgi:hypothetical protein